MKKRFDFGFLLSWLLVLLGATGASLVRGAELHSSPPKAVTGSGTDTKGLGAQHGHSAQAKQIPFFLAEFESCPSEVLNDPLHSAKSFMLSPWGLDFTLKSSTGFQLDFTLKSSTQKLAPRCPQPALSLAQPLSIREGKSFMCDLLCRAGRKATLPE